MTKKPTTSEELQRAIAKIISKRAIEASQIPYDTKVWVGAVAEARRVFERVALVETIEAYHKAVVRALSIASDTYMTPMANIQMAEVELETFYTMSWACYRPPKAALQIISCLLLRPYQPRMQRLHSASMGK